MPRTRALLALKLVSKRGKRLGAVEHVLFHPDEPRVVGFQVMRPRFAYIIDRKPLFVPLTEVVMGTERLDARNEKLVSGAKAARRLGITWDATVIWAGMPVRTRSGTMAGAVHDVKFAEDGQVTTLVLSEGMTSDVAVGRRTIEGRHVKGFREDAVIIEDVLQQAELSGGAAATAGRGVAVAKKTATDAAVKAVIVGKATARVAAESKMGKKALGAFKGLVHEVKDAMGRPDDEDS